MMLSPAPMAPEPLTQPQDGPKMHASWLNLPGEVRFRILNMVSQDYQDHRRALYATVCSEWQCFFEEITFRHLLLDDTALDALGRIMNGKNTHRKYHVRHLWLLIVLPGYSCPSCRRPENRVEIYQNNKVFANAMEKLLGILSTWVPIDGSGGLTLELGIKSSSDSEHHYDDITTYNDYPFKSWNKLFDPIDMKAFHIAQLDHDALDSRREHYLLGLSAWRRQEDFRIAPRYLGSLLQFQGLQNKHLPRVEIVNSLLIRHQYKRQLSPLALTKLFRESLIYATSFRLERWCRTTTEEEDQYLQDFREHLLPSLPDSLQSFHYFAENLKDGRDSIRAQTDPFSVFELLHTHGHRFKEISAVEPSGTGNRLAEMEHISAVALAKPLLPAQWHKLERICFRSDVLHSGKGMGPISRLLVLTARVAEKLPNLRSLEIFNNNTAYLRRDSYLFRYSIECSGAELSWESKRKLPMRTNTPRFEFCPQVKCAWEKAAVAHTGLGITICLSEPKTETVDGIVVREHFSPKDRPRLAEVFKLDAIHPFGRALMGVCCDRMWF